MDKFKIDDLYLAYRKFKNNVYYDTSSLYVRQQLANFESQFYSKMDVNDSDAKLRKTIDNFLAPTLNIVNGDDPDNKLFNGLLRKVGVKRCIKKVADSDSDSSVISNLPQIGKYSIESLNYVVDMPIEIHLIAVLWVMTAGLKINNIIGKQNYAYRLSLKDKSNLDSALDYNDDEMSSGLKLYAPYFDGYQNWRDNAIRSAISLLDEKKHATIVSLDIKRYFYSVRMNVVQFIANCSEKYADKCNFTEGEQRLTELLQGIHTAYYEILRKNFAFDDKSCQGGEYPLPVGLLSSGVLGNAYLIKFDELILKDLKPVYYGRYVDDILIVLGNYAHNGDSGIAKSTFMTDLFVNNGILSTKHADDGCYYLHGYPNLMIQGKKVSIEYFDYRESRAVINKFKKNIDKNRSEFRFLPYEDRLDVQFEDEAFSIGYKDTVNKLRSIKEFTTNKYGASKYLAHKIFLSIFPVKGDNDIDKHLSESSRQIMSFFKGAVALNMSSLWEKVATFFIVNSTSDYLIEFYKRVLQAISMIDKIGDSDCCHQEKDSNEVFIAELKTDLIDYLCYAIAIPLSMNLKFADKLSKIDRINEIREYAESIRKSYLFRQYLIQNPAICYTNKGSHPDANLFDIEYTCLSDVKFDVRMAKYLAPIFVPSQDFNLICSLSNVISGKTGEEKPYEIAFEEYKNFNFSWRKVKDPQPLVTVSDNKGYFSYDIKDDFETNISNKKIGIANLKVLSSDVTSGILDTPNLSIARRNNLFEIINYAIKKKVELIVLPELSVPVAWVSLLVRQCCRNNIGMIFGIEYLCNSALDAEPAYNTTAVLLPVHQNGMSSCFIQFRPKKYYSPGEIEFVRGHHKKIPQSNNVKYELFHWRSCYFSVYNCFELTNISDRALFKSKVDFIVATEFNRDVKYFSNIVDAWSRDIHCYIVQVNSSQYGDSRIISPSKSEIKDLVCVKGGMYPILIVDTLDIDKLRQFQIRDYNLQLKPPFSEQFKPNPADFKFKNALLRINNEDSQQLE